MPSDTAHVVKQLSRELANFEDIAKYIKPAPGETPLLAGIEVCGGTMPLNGVIGGDHLIYLDFKQRFDLDARIEQASRDGREDIVDNLRRCQRMAGIAILDVSGHHMTDAMMAAMLHQAFLLGAIYELDQFGHITRRLFENLNTRFYQSSGAHKYVSMIYGEISEEARFRFISAAHPLPAVFSNEHDRFMEVGDDLRVSFPPLGMLPSLDMIDRSRMSSVLGFKDHYQMNEWTLMGRGDILLLHTDGLAEHVDAAGEAYFPARLEDVLRRVKHGSAPEIYDAIRVDFAAFGEPADDVSFVVIKRT
jgi:serine phosphatase RsbU (regulator of sigma subunit)